MSKSHFQFKQFGIDQKGATLKVCTDSCLFGAWVASSMPPSKRVLDIGTGSSLLALCLAQKHAESEITAIEIDPTSAFLASQNVANSPWKDRIKVQEIALQEFNPENLFNCIVSNPPFFEGQLPSASVTKNLAKHQVGLTKEELIHHAIRMLDEYGILYVLFPESEGRIFQQLSSRHGLFLHEEIKVRNKPSGPAFRLMQKYGFQKKEMKNAEVVIYARPNVYSPSFVALLKDYYLYL